jgi:predicted nucleic acid-binding protein
MKRDRLFLDANILFSAAYREQSGLLKLWNMKSVDLISSQYAIEEARRNLDSYEQRERLAELLLKVITIYHWATEGIILPDHITLREKNIPILVAAIAANADYLLTGDMRDFGQFFGKVIEGVIILPPSDYLNHYR